MKNRQLEINLQIRTKGNWFRNGICTPCIWSVGKKSTNDFEMFIPYTYYNRNVHFSYLFEGTGRSVLISQTAICIIPCGFSLKYSTKHYRMIWYFLFYIKHDSVVLNKNYEFYVIMVEFPKYIIYLLSRLAVKIGTIISQNFSPN